MNPVSVPIHLQDEFGLCGQACAQMTTRVLSAALHPQSDFGPSTPKVPGWFTTPDQLRELVNRFLPQSALTYKVWPKTGLVAAMNRAYAAVDRPSGVRYPALALTNDGDHWEVVHGFTYGTRVNPMVHVRNPAPDRVNLLKPVVPGPHLDTDDCNTFNIGWGALEDEAWEWTDWTGKFTKCQQSNAPWQNKYVVLAPSVPARKMKRAGTKKSGAKKHAAPLGPLTGVDRSRIGGHAIQVLRQSGLLAYPWWRDSLAEVQDDPRVLLVAGLGDRDKGDRHQTPYGLVALTGANGRGALVGLDAATGELRFARLNPAPQLVESLFKPMDTLVPAWRRARPSYTVRIVWRSARESFFSPFFPFAEFSDRRGPRFYVRLVDGMRFDAFEKRDLPRT